MKKRNMAALSIFLLAIFLTSPAMAGEELAAAAPAQGAFADIFYNNWILEDPNLLLPLAGTTWVLAYRLDPRDATSVIHDPIVFGTSVEATELGTGLLCSKYGVMGHAYYYKELIYQRPGILIVINDPGLINYYTFEISGETAIGTHVTKIVETNQTIPHYYMAGIKLSNPDPTIPAPVLAFTTLMASTTLTWTPVANAAGYYLYFDPTVAGAAFDGNFDAVVDLGTAFTLTVTLWPGASYYVGVQAYNGNTVSPLSNIELVSIP